MVAKLFTLAGIRFRTRYGIFGLCAVLLVMATVYLFVHHAAALDEHTAHRHYKHMFTARGHVAGHVQFVPMKLPLHDPGTHYSVREPKDSAHVGTGHNNSVELADTEMPPLIEAGSNRSITTTVKKDLSYSINPKCRRMLGSLTSMMSQWGKARKEIGQRQSMSAINRITVGRFYTVSFGCVTISNEGSPVTFVMIWKCANDAIRKNLMAYEANRPVLNPRNASQKLIDKKESHKASEFRRKIGDQFGLKSPPKSFSFAREPISHFISGISEYYWRNYKNSRISTEELQRKLNGMLEFTQLNEKKDSIKERSRKYILWHFFAMAGILKQDYNIGYLGKLESFDEDWGIINRLYNVNVTINRTLGWHESSDDPNGVKAAFKDLFKRDIRYKKALCQLLYIDYVCFNYELPSECQIEE